MLMSVNKEKKGDRVYTPEWAARDMIEFFKPTGRVLEPFKGAGVFTDLCPTWDWCEIDEGRDFFQWKEPVDWVVSNPPYSKLRPVWNHAATIADNIVYLIPLRNFFSGYGFVREALDYGGIVHIRLYGTGGHYKTVLLITHLDSLKDIADMTIDIERQDGYAYVNQ